MSKPVLHLVTYEPPHILPVRLPLVPRVRFRIISAMPCGCSNIDVACLLIVRALKAGTWKNVIGRRLMREKFLGQSVRYLCHRNISMFITVRDNAGVRSFGSFNSAYRPKIGGNVETFSFVAISDALDGLGP